MTAQEDYAGGRWLGQRGIYCHAVPDVEDIDPKEYDGTVVFDTMVTSVAHWCPDIRGEVTRLITDGEVSYESRIVGLPVVEDGFCTDDYRVLCAVEKLANDMRYMLDAIADPASRGEWSIWSGQ